MKIRTNHHYGFRSGEWAEIAGCIFYNQRACYVVVFPIDESSRNLPRIDLWMVEDPDGRYEFE